MNTSHQHLTCIVVTPEQAVLDEPADFVAVPMFDGELGILPGRAPIIGRLGTGELRLNKNGSVHRLFVDGGFVQVRANVVTLLTSRAVEASEINPQVVEAELHAAEAKHPTDLVEREIVDKTEQRARAMLRIVRKI